ENFHTIVNGIIESIKRAHKNLSEGNLYLNSGFSSNKPGERYGRNRSIEAYYLNPKDEIEKYKTEDGEYDVTNRRMTVLKFVRDNGTEIGMYNWAAVHPHVSGQYLKLINGDSKGYASYLFEKDHKTDYLEEDTFVAAFAMNDAGDSSSNLPEDAYDYDDVELDENGNYPCDGIHDYKRMVERAKTQYELARIIYDNTGEELTGSVDYRQMYVHFPSFKIAPDYISPHEVRYKYPDSVDEDIENCRLCEPIAGLGMFSGSTEDSVGLIDNEGHARDVADNRSFMDFLEEPLANGLFDLIWRLFMPRELIQEDRDCHLEKINALPMGRGEYMIPNGKAVTEILPIQILKIGRFAIVSLPFEVTTMSGRRIRDDIKKILDDVTYVEINAISNAFMGYLTTRDEYSIQHYEGGENWFGPYTLNGIRQMLSELASTFQTGDDLPDYSLAIDDIRNTLEDQKIKVGKVKFDNKPVCKKFGDVIEGPEQIYNKGKTVRVKFWGGHPNNNFQTQLTYLVVEKKGEGGWEFIAADWDPSTFFRWKSTGLNMSEITVEWIIPKDAESGEYRICHFGNWKSALTRRIYPYTGISDSFIVQ
ncbi:MAG: neutral/alkaline non-lysosomal ceramidase N-terminal domain-containing protein, partial [Thermodesulfobacteriota bacterium]|nr:neutral/alkaline non-lysosomal ceramidase N-terminal domain-containing protein [Thermodesulfobacteriota bacterium]